MKSLSILAVLSSLVVACAADSDDAPIREHDGHLEFRDRNAFQDTLHQLAARTPEELDRWERGFASFRSARSWYSQAVAEDQAAAASSAAQHSEFVTDHEDLFVFDADGHFELDLPRSPDRLDLVVDRQGIVKIGESIFRYRRDVYKEILDGDERTLARLDQITETSRDDHVMVYKLDPERATLGSPSGGASFDGNYNECIGYTGGGGQRVKGVAQVATYVTVDINGNLGFPGQVVCDTQVFTNALNQSNTIFGWWDKATAQLRISGVVYMNSPVVSSNPVTVNVSDSNTVTYISKMLYESGYIPCSWLPNGSFPLDLSGYLDFYGRDGSYCGMYGQRRDHFYTIYSGERDNAISSYGYRNLGTAAYIYGFQASGTTPLYRLLGADGRHFYTIYSGERDNAVAIYHYVYEGVAGYVYQFQAAGTTPLYRLADGPYGGTEHYYTIDAGQRDYYISHYGFISEGIAAYVYGYEEANTTPLYEMSK